MDKLDGIVMVNGQTGRLWLCKRHDGHALGLRVKVQREGLSVEQLMLFREAVMPECVQTEARHLCFAEGTAHTIECSICRARRTWWMSENGKNLLVKTYLAE